MSTHDLCRCGVYRYVHEEPTQIRCQRFRKAGPLAAYRINHSIRRHVKAWLWLKVPVDTRWLVVDAIHKRIRDACWCDLVAGVMAERERFGCLCDVHLPTIYRLTPDDANRCYCPPVESA